MRRDDIRILGPTARTERGLQFVKHGEGGGGRLHAPFCQGSPCVGRAARPLDVEFFFHELSVFLNELEARVGALAHQAFD